MSNLNRLKYFCNDSYPNSCNQRIEVESCDPLQMCKIPAEILLNLDFLTDGRFMREAAGPHFTPCPHTSGRSSLEISWTFGMDRVSSGCSDYQDWFATIDNRLEFFENNAEEK